MNPYYRQVVQRASHRCEYCHAPNEQSNTENGTTTVDDSRAFPIASVSWPNYFKQLITLIQALLFGLEHPKQIK